MSVVINKDESADALRSIPIYLEKPDGTPQTSTSGLTITYRIPGAGSETTKTLTSIGNGRYLMVLDGAGEVATQGVGWVSITGTTIIPFVDWVYIRPFEPNILALLPSSLDGGNMRAKVEAIDSTVLTSVVTAIWDALCSGHLVSGSFGELVQVVAGLLHLNAMVDTITFGTDNLTTVWRLRCFDTKAHLDAATPGHSAAETGEVFRHTGSSVDALSGGQWTSMKMGRTL